MESQEERWTRLVDEGKTRVDGEMCCVRDCKAGFDYHECVGFVPPGWKEFYLIKAELIGLLCPSHKRQFPTQDDVAANLASFDPEKMIERPDDA